MPCASCNAQFSVLRRRRRTCAGCEAATCQDCLDDAQLCAACAARAPGMAALDAIELDLRRALGDARACCDAARAQIAGGDRDIGALVVQCRNDVVAIDQAVLRLDEVQSGGDEAVRDRRRALLRSCTAMLDGGEPAQAAEALRALEQLWFLERDAASGASVADADAVQRLRSGVTPKLLEVDPGFEGRLDALLLP